MRESTVDNSVAHLQEELIAVKLREAEANLSLKELRQRVTELGAQWQRHLQVKLLIVNGSVHIYNHYSSILYKLLLCFIY